MKSVRVDAPTFDGHLDPRVFLDWVAGMDHYFKLYDTLKDPRVRFTKMKLVRQAKLYWTTVEHQLQAKQENPISFWDEMKEKL